MSVRVILEMISHKPEPNELFRRLATPHHHQQHQVPAVLEKLRAAGKRMFFVTNNSTKSRKGYKSKFTSLGLNVRTHIICMHV
jgi:hypothetical protein